MASEKRDAVLYRQVRDLPMRIERARRRLADLERQAASYGFHDLLHERNGQ